MHSVRDLRRVRNEQRTRKRGADHSPFRWRFATPAQGREQPSGPASGRQSAPNRGVAHAPALSATSAKCVSCAAQNAPLVVLSLNLQVVGVERLARATLIDTGPSTTGFDEQLSVTELRQPPLFVAAPLAASAVSKSEADNQGGKALRNRAGPSRKCHQDLTVRWCSLCPAAEAMAPCTRGVSDLGCGRGHDRRPGQISWSLTPRSPRWRGDDRGDGEPSATCADRVLETRSLHRTSTCRGRQKSVSADWLESDQRGTSQEKGNTSRGALFPSLFPLARCHVFGFASLRIGFAAAPNLRPGTSSAVMAPSFFSSRTSSLTCLGNHHSGLTPACRSCHRSGRRARRFSIQSRRGRRSGSGLIRTC